MHPRTRLGLLVGGLVLVGAVVLASPAASPDPGEVGEPARTEATVKFVEPVPDGTTQLWPFTSRAESFDRATLPINVVVREDAAFVRGLLTKEGVGQQVEAAEAGEGDAIENESEWDESMPVQEHEEPAGIEWGRGHGANRYTYVRTTDDSRWLAQTDQLRDGSYFGSQYHLRLYGYDTGNTSWTAIQAHHEHWDWFRLRHTVDGVSSAQHYVERDFVDRGLLRGISRERYANGGAIDADGWVTVVDIESRQAPGLERASDKVGSPPTRNGAVLGLSILGLPVLGLPVLGLPVLGLVLATRTRLYPESTGVLGRLTPYHLGLFASTALLVVLVRAGGIVLEQALPGAPPWIVGTPVFLLLVVGYPAVAVLFGRRLPSEEAFAAAVLGMGAGILADYSYIGVTALPYDAVVQRLVLLFGLGLLAAGGTRWAESTLARHKYRLAGLGIWVGAILKPLLGL